MKNFRYILFLQTFFLVLAVTAQEKTSVPAATGFANISTPWFFVAIGGGVLFIIALVWNIQTKRVLKFTEASITDLQEQVKEEKVKMENQIKERTVGIAKLNEQLNAQISDLHKEMDEKLKLISELKELLEVKSSGDFLPICSNCKDIRDEYGYWKPIEEFIQELSDSDLSHTLCPDCTKKLYPELFEGGAKPFCLSWNPNKARRRDH